MGILGCTFSFFYTLLSLHFSPKRKLINIFHQLIFWVRPEAGLLDALVCWTIIWRAEYRCKEFVVSHDDHMNRSRDNRGATAALSCLSVACPQGKYNHLLPALHLVTSHEQITSDLWGHHANPPLNGNNVGVTHPLSLKPGFPECLWADLKSWSVSAPRLASLREETSDIFDMLSLILWLAPG